MHRIASSDPLALGPRSIALLRREGLLVDPQRLYEGAIIEVACEMSLEDRAPRPEEVDGWLAGRLERTLARILNRDAEWVRNGGGDDPAQAPGAFLARTLRLDPARMDEPTVRFHNLSKRTRRRFFALVLDGWTLTKTAEWFGGDAREIADDLWEALFLLGLAREEHREGMLDELLRRESTLENQP
ncbi:MAG TPA: hypothetical protein ENJ09_02535 [Planctomycetes bacterium]|nr:hypothetical protein [Planctomycetota bacterium]